MGIVGSAVGFWVSESFGYAIGVNEEVKGTQTQPLTERQLKCPLKNRLQFLSL